MKFGCRRVPTIETITADLGVNTTEYIMTIDKPMIKEIKRILKIRVYSNNTVATQVYCGL